jgi:hypothetical protein
VADNEFDIRLGEDLQIHVEVGHNKEHKCVGIKLIGMPFDDEGKGTVILTISGARMLAQTLLDQADQAEGPGGKVV